uniref:ARAD1C22968p n=1 Tax=Blastobotrys adeninivorans TaxID=409370 RepID=A0A060T6T7_BLAAD
MSEAISIPRAHSRTSSTGSVDYEPRGRRRLSSESSSASAARFSIYAKGSSPVNSTTEFGPPKLPTPMTTGDVYDAMEREQEAIVNRLQREIATLKTERDQSRSRSRSQSGSSLSRNPSQKSVSDIESTPNRAGGGSKRGSISRASFSSQSGDEYSSLRRENESLKKKLADLSLRLAEKDAEIERLRKH